jgi:hypothetical protein
MKLAADDDWSAPYRGPLALQIGLATFGILALELALLRWTAGQVRASAYFDNLVLLALYLAAQLFALRRESTLPSGLDPSPIGAEPAVAPV